MSINIDLSPEQTQAIDYLQDDETNLVLYGGQAGGGKSFLISLWQIFNRLSMPGTRGYIAREQGLKKIEESILVTFMDLVSSLQLGKEVSYNGSKHLIEFSNGSTITLIDAFYYPSDPNFDRLGSTEYTDGAIEEGITIHKKAQQLLLSRTRYKNIEYGLTAKQLITCNPGEGYLRDEVVIPSLEGTLKKEYKFVNATLDSNPNKEFVKSYKTTLNLLDDYDRARLLHGDWFAQPKTGGEFYKKFDEKQIVKKIQYNNSMPLHITFDFNVNPYMTCCVWQLDGSKAMQIDEICLPTPRNTTRETCKEFTHRYNDHNAGLFIYGDPAGRHEDTRTEKGHNDYRVIEEELKDYKPNLRVKSKAPSVVARGNFINAIFDSLVEGVEIQIDESCNKTISDYNFVKEAPDGTKAKTKITDPTTKVRYEKYGHTSDANDYFITFVFNAEFDAYQRGSRPKVYGYGGRQLKQNF